MTKLDDLAATIDPAAMAHSAPHGNSCRDCAGVRGSQQNARRKALKFLKALRGDPGHAATEALCEPMQDRTPFLAVWNNMVDGMIAEAEEQIAQPAPSDAQEEKAA